MLSLIIVLYPLAHILSLVPKPGSCQILRNHLICVFGVRDSGKNTYSGVMGDRMPQIIHTRYQNDRSSMTIILVCHNSALRVCISHNLRKCDISDPILTLFLISECHQLFFCEIVIYFIASPLIAQTASIFQLTFEHNGVTLTPLAASQKPPVQLYPPPPPILQYTK